MLILALAFGVMLLVLSVFNTTFLAPSTLGLVSNVVTDTFLHFFAITSKDFTYTMFFIASLFVAALLWM